MNKTTFLIVDDDSTSLLLMSTIIMDESNDFEVLQAFNIDDAMMIAKKHLPQIIITDWRMPNGDGIELIQRLKHDNNTINIPVIIVTALMLKSDDKFNVFEKGASDFIRKPLDSFEFTARINAILNTNKFNNQYKKRLLT